MMKIQELLGIKFPIFQGAMANIATPEFAACVSNCGGLGIIATGAMDKEMTKAAIRRCKELTQKPFGVNVMLMSPHVEEIMQVIMEEGVDVVTTGAGNPGPYVEALKAHGCKVFPVVSSVALARRMERLGVDGVIAEGCESGGHVGEMTTMALVPQVVDALSIPVIAAGGIGDGRGACAAFALGASGIQIGTILLASEECEIHENYKKAVCKAKDADTVVTGRKAGAPVRILKNQMALEYLKLEADGADREEMEKLTLGSLRRAVFDGDVKRGSLMMGQIAGMCKEVRPMKAIIETLWNETIQCCKNMQKLGEAYEHTTSTIGE